MLMKTAMTSLSASVSVGCLGILLGLFGLVGTTFPDGSSMPQCKEDFPAKQRVMLCHNVTTASLQESQHCGGGSSEGFVLMPFLLAPLLFYMDCGFQRFHTLELYDAQCMRNLTHQEDEYDRIIFDILDKVSGQSRIPTPTVVDRFPLTVVKDGKRTEDFSAFVVFRNMCRTADPEHSSGMINPCSNQTVKGTFVYFTLRGMPDLPEVPSMCRCVLRPSVDLKVLALDVRLQIASDRRCGRSALKIETNETSRDIQCHKMTALYGNHELYSSDKPEEVTLTLTSISKDEVPTSVWIRAEDDYQYQGKEMSVTCGGFIPMPTEPPNTGKDSDDADNGDGDDDDGDGGGGEDEAEAASAGADFPIIPVVGGLAGLIILITVVTIIIIKRRRSGSFNGLIPTCGQCCQQEPDDGLISYKQVSQQEPVYAEPGKPRPSTTTPPYVFPADAKLPDSRAVYAEPDPNGTLALAAHSGTPPPIPEVPPPGSPPMFPPGTPPPKPERTLLRQRKESTRSTPSEEDYDHIVTGGKTPLKSPRGRDGQNNIIGEGEGENARGESNVYDCLRHGDDYSQIGDNHKQEVKDNVNDTTA